MPHERHVQRRQLDVHLIRLNLDDPLQIHLEPMDGLFPSRRLISYILSATPKRQ